MPGPLAGFMEEFAAWPGPVTHGPKKIFHAPCNQVPTCGELKAMDAVPYFVPLSRPPGVAWAWITLRATSGRGERNRSERVAMTSEAVREHAPEGPSAIELELRHCFVLGLGGDAASYRQFLEALACHLRAYLRRRLPRALEDVEDILQETLLAIHNARHTYRAGEPVTAWVHAITRYKLMDFFRAHARREALHDPIGDDDLFVASDAEPADARRDVGQLLGTLPDRHRVPIELVKLQGLSITEAARCSGLSESAVKVGIHRGLKALAARIRGGA